MRFCCGLLVVFLSLLCFIGSVSAKNLDGQLGVGLSYPGLQIQYGLAESVLVEAKIQFGSENTLIGSRGYYFFESILPDVDLQPYLGLEIDVPLSPHLTEGRAIGGLIGLDLFELEHIGINADVGIFYVSLNSKIGSKSDVGAIFNVGLTYYF